MCTPVFNFCFFQSKKVANSETVLLSASLDYLLDRIWEVSIRNDSQVFHIESGFVFASAIHLQTLPLCRI